MITNEVIKRRTFLKLLGTFGLVSLSGGLESLIFSSVAHAEDNIPLRLQNDHTKEKYEIQLFNKGEWNKEGLMICDWLMRDFRENSTVHCDPKLYAALYVLQRYFADNKFLLIKSGYRTEKTNKMLREVSLQESGGKETWLTPAINSMHIEAKAVDFFIPDADMSKVAEAVWLLNIGGLGEYKGKFIHMDTGDRRRWGRS